MSGDWPAAQRSVCARALRWVRFGVSDLRSKRQSIVHVAVRQMALEAIQTDARDLKLTLVAVADEVKNVRANITQLVQNPLDMAAQKLLVPAALSLLRGLRSKKEHA